MGATGIGVAKNGDVMRQIGQFIDWVTPLLAFAVFVAAESMVIYYFLKVLGALK